MPIVFASAATVPIRVRATPYFMSWTGFDGSVWPLSDPHVLPAMERGVKGLHMPAFTTYQSETPLVRGVEHTGYTVQPRSVYWPMFFQADNEAEWRSRYGGFFDSFHPVEAGTWTVGEGANRRTLPLTGVFDGSYAFGMDPFVTGWAMIGVELLAPRPLWRGVPVSRRFTAQDGVDFIQAGLAPEFHISPAATFSSATISNPGNEPSYLTWTVEGPQDDLFLGVGGATIDVPFAVPDGSVLRIDTDPANQFATLDGVDVTTDLGFQTFAPVPARGTSPLSIAASGAGAVNAELVPLYWRAF